MLKLILFTTVSTSILHATPERGEVIYKQMCFVCHGPKLEGGKGPALKDAYWQHGSSPEAILDTIKNGVPNTEMIGYKDVYPAEDVLALRDYLLSEQAGLRDTVRSYYENNRFKGKKLTPELFNSVESSKQTPIPENSLWIERKHTGGVRMQSTLYIKEAGEYRIQLNSKYRNSIYIDGEEVFYLDPEAAKEMQVNKKITLKPGAHSFELLHESKAKHGWRVTGSLIGPKGEKIAINGSTLAGSLPKEIHAGAQAKVIRKWIRDTSPRSLLCLLPNKVIVSFDSENGTVTHAWKGAFVDQTPSLPDRSASPSEIAGKKIADPAKGLSVPRTFDLIAYETQGDKALIHARVDGQLRTLTIAPEGNESFTITSK